MQLNEKLIMQLKENVKSIVSILVCNLLFYIYIPIALATPPGYGIKSVEILSSSYNPRTEIYANGRMQAHLRVLYELEEGFTLDSVSLRELYIKKPIEEEKWVISDKGNEYKHEIKESSSFQEYDEEVSLSDEQLNMAAKPYVDKFISTDKEQRMKVCVILSAKSSDGTVSKSTCDGESNNAFVLVETHRKKTYSIEDFQRDDYDSGWNLGSKYGFRYVRKTLIPNGFLIKNIKPIGKIQDYGYGRWLIASKKAVWETPKPIGKDKHRMDSALWLILPSDNEDMVYKNFRYPYRTAKLCHGRRWSWKNTGEYTYNINNKLHMVILYGSAARLGEDCGMVEYSVNPLVNWEILASLNFFDVYGNKGLIKIERAPFKKWRNVSYNFYD